MDRDGMPSAFPRLPANRAVDFRRWPILAVALAISICAAPDLRAQTVIGGTSPDVQVDLSVLDSLGPAPTLPELLRRQLPTSKTHLTAPGTSHGSNKVSLHAPRAAKTKRVATAHASSKKSKPKAAAHQVAAVKPAAPVAPKASPPPPSVAAAPATPATEPAAPSQTPAAAAPPPAQPLPGPRVATAAAMAAGIAPTASPPAPAEPAPAATPVAATSTAPPTTPSRPMPGVTPAAAPAAVAAASAPNRVIFAAGAADLPDAARRDLDALAQRLTANPQTRLQLVAYASGSAEEANQARRISLSRALAVRSYLIEHGVPNSRMDVRALGNRNDNGGPLDRVDIVLLDR